MKNFLTIFMTISIFGLWIIPAFMMYHDEPSDTPSFWGMLYIPIIVITLMWISVVNRAYFVTQENTKE